MVSRVSLFRAASGRLIAGYRAAFRVMLAPLVGLSLLYALYDLSGMSSVFSNLLVWVLAQFLLSLLAVGWFRHQLCGEEPGWYGQPWFPGLAIWHALKFLGLTVMTCLFLLFPAAIAGGLWVSFAVDGYGYWSPDPLTLAESGVVAQGTLLALVMVFLTVLNWMLLRAGIGLPELVHRRESRGFAASFADTSRLSGPLWIAATGFTLILVSLTLVDFFSLSAMMFGAPLRALLDTLSMLVFAALLAETYRRCQPDYIAQNTEGPARLRLFGNVILIEKEGVNPDA